MEKKSEKKKGEIKNVMSTMMDINKNNAIKSSIFLFIIYIFISSKTWGNIFLRKFNLIDNFNNISSLGYIINGIILISLFIILNCLINNKLL